jgi:anthranilate phosphoribosyltransferase
MLSLSGMSFGLNMNDKDAKDMSLMYEDLYAMIAKWLQANNKPLAIGAVLMATAMRMYRTALNEEDYYLMMDYLSNTRDKIERFPTSDDIKNTLN